MNSDIGKENERVYNIKNCIVGGGGGGTININYIYITKNSRRRNKFVSLKLIFAYALKNSFYILCFYVFSYLDVKGIRIIVIIFAYALNNSFYSSCVIISIYLFRCKKILCHCILFIL